MRKQGPKCKIGMLVRFNSEEMLNETGIIEGIMTKADGFYYEVSFTGGKSAIIKEKEITQAFIPTSLIQRKSRSKIKEVVKEMPNESV